MNIRVTGDSVEIDGYVNAVERLSKPLNDRLGKFVERVKVGAFQRALDRADDVRILLNHEWARDLGGTKEGNLELYEDAIGLHARTTITDAEVVKQARNGELVGWSFGFTDRDVEQGEENGLVVRNVKDLDLYEVSLINREKIPAYDGTLIAVRTADDKNSVNIGDMIAEKVNLTVEPIKEDNPAEEKRAVDYTKYKKMIAEAKGVPYEEL